MAINFMTFRILVDGVHMWLSAIDLEGVMYWTDDESKAWPFESLESADKFRKRLCIDTHYVTVNNGKRFVNIVVMP